MLIIVWFKMFVVYEMLKQWVKPCLIIQKSNAPLTVWKFSLEPPILNKNTAWIIALYIFCHSIPCNSMHFLLSIHELGTVQHARIYETASTRNVLFCLTSKAPNQPHVAIESIQLKSQRQIHHWRNRKWCQRSIDKC